MLKNFLRFLKNIFVVGRCRVFNHALAVQKHIKGSHPAGNWVACLRCERCGCRYIVSEAHEAFLRYDDDPKFRADILRMYGEYVTAEEL